MHEIRTVARFDCIDIGIVSDSRQSLIPTATGVNIINWQIKPFKLYFEND